MVWMHRGDSRRPCGVTRGRPRATKRRSTTPGVVQKKATTFSFSRSSQASRPLQLLGPPKRAADGTTTTTSSCVLSFCADLEHTRARKCDVDAALYVRRALVVVRLGVHTNRREKANDDPPPSARLSQRSRVEPSRRERRHADNDLVSATNASTS